MNRIGVALLILIASATQASPPFARPGGGGGGGDAEFAAGYAALFTCSAHFIMGRPLDDIIAVELADLAQLDLPAPEIDSRRYLVRAKDQKGREAIAVYRDTMGCVVLPPHLDERDVPDLPYVAYPPAPDRSQIPFPRGDLAEVAMTKAQQTLLDRAMDGQSFGEGTVTVATLVLKNGQLIGERYRPGFGIHTGYRTWSTAKSVAATLVGIAVADGVLALDQTDLIPEWRYFDDPRRAISLRHLLQMSSGLKSEGAGTNALYFGGQDVVSSITQMPLEAAPGERWKYANADTLLALYALRRTLNQDLDYLRFPYDRLFHRIGMHHSRYETDHLGNFIGSSQMYTTARDLARFGQLYLNKGEWFGERIFPRSWVDVATASAPALPREPNKRGYGAQFWLLDRFPGVPEGTYTTAGNKGQFVTIVPEFDMVIVRTGVDPNGKRWDHEAFIPAVLDAFSAEG